MVYRLVVVGLFVNSVVLFNFFKFNKFGWGFVAVIIRVWGDLVLILTLGL